MELTLDEALQKGIEAHKTGQVQDAERLYTAILQAQPNHPDANHNMGVLAVGVGKIQEALPFFKIALETKPSTGQFWLSYINALIKLDRIANAKAVFDQAKGQGLEGEWFDQVEKWLFDTSSIAVKLQDPPSDQLQSIAKLYSQGQLGQVLSVANQMLEKFPNSIILHNMLGASNAGLKQFDAAVDNFKKVLKIDPNDAIAYNNMGSALQDMGNAEAAIDCYKNALKINPDFCDAYNNMGNAFRNMGNTEAAIDRYNMALKIRPDYAEAYNNMGHVLKDKGDLNAAIVSYKKAIKIRPNYAEAHYNIGNAFEEKGNTEAAIGSFRQALKIKPDFPEAYNNMGAALRNKGDLEAAIECYDKLNNKESIAQALECTYILGGYDKFNQRLETIAKKDPSNIRVAAMSAFAAQQIKQKDPYPFCENPLELLQFSHIKNHVPNSNKFINSILDEMNSNKTAWAPKEHTTRNGFRTSGTLFSNPSSNMKILEDIIKKELTLFYSKHKANKSILIKNWPNEIKVTAWYVRLLQSGYQTSHIHPNGWVSGVFYLQTIKEPTQQEGAIEFGLYGYDYPVINEYWPRRLYQPSDGDLVLFPSSLFHKTIPVIKNVERCVIAFDLIG